MTTPEVNFFMDHETISILLFDVHLSLFCGHALSRCLVAPPR